MLYTRERTVNGPMIKYRVILVEQYDNDNKNSKAVSRDITKVDHELIYWLFFDENPNPPDYREFEK